MRNLTRGARRGGVLPGRAHIARFVALTATGGLVALAGGCGSPASAAGSRIAPAATATATAAGRAAATGPGSRSGISGGALFGGSTALAAQQGQLGRPLAIVRVYYQIGQAFPKPHNRLAMAAGSTVLVSLDSTPGQGPGYAAIAAGQQDKAITSFLVAVDQAAVRYHLGAIYICFQHEPDVMVRHGGLGTPAQFVAAWDHVRRLAQAARLDWNEGGRLHWVWILTHASFAAGAASSYWPGSGQVDIIGADGYNTSSCRRAPAGSNLVAQGTRATTPARLFDPALGFARAHGGLPVFIAEWASVPYVSSGVQPGFIDQMSAYVAANPDIAAALYWSGHGQGNGCDYELTGRPASLSALSAMGQSAALQGAIGQGG